MIKIFGHYAPDTDATGSALIWEWFLNEVKGKSAKAYVLGEPNTEAAFVLKRWGFETPEILADLAGGDDVIVVDTNNPAELPENINDTNIVEIIDHHMLAGGLKTAAPIMITIRPVASTATVMYGRMKDAAAQMPKGIKGLMLSCILSDTLEFRSPTTTERDRFVADLLAKDLGIDMAAYASEMFEAKSDISRFSDAELLRMDSKKYEIGSTSFRVSVLETTSPKIVMDRKVSLMETMGPVAAEDGVDQVLLFVVDILNEASTLLVPNELVKTLAEKSFAVTVAGDTVLLPGVMSRKKQIIPSLTL